MARRESAGATATGAAELGAGLAGGAASATGAAIAGAVAGEGVSLVAVVTPAMLPPITVSTTDPTSSGSQLRRVRRCLLTGSPPD